MQIPLFPTDTEPLTKECGIPCNGTGHLYKASRGFNIDYLDGGTNCLNFSI